MYAREPESQQLRAGRGVYLLDGQEVLRRGLRQLLEPQGFVIVGESGSARTGTEEILALCPDLAIVADDLSDGSGAGVCRNVAVRNTSVRCLLITAEPDEAVLIESILAGAWGCLTKEDPNTEQLRLIRRAQEGFTAFSSRFTPELLAEAPHARLDRPADRLLALSRQELRVAFGVSGGLSNGEIGQELTLADKTVKNIVSSVLMKLGVERRTQAAVLITKTLDPSHGPTDTRFMFTPFPELTTEITDALTECTSDTEHLTVQAHDGGADRLANALTAARTKLTPTRTRTGTRPKNHR
ncbi:LuxR C-terminal-related transcriptional regulator [Arthrobacter sp. 31Y]|uniref:LuxR C-terminal-related transcriptional regulator n=1 Tax=Arthrobacter sp. 31Y TaxID=1115632 RepID=UPI0004B2278E|nr:response regulator transcription factor [Arthrobacter sp. 31Y]